MLSAVTHSVHCVLTLSHSVGVHTKVQRAGSCVAGGWKRTVVSYQHEREPRLHAADRPSTAHLQQMCARLDVMMHTHNLDFGS